MVHQIKKRLDSKDKEYSGKKPEASSLLKHVRETIRTLSMV